MLRFFRQIRKKLMEQNKTRSYIYYAIGEILLVMIGILLALQVNNWNEIRVLQLEEQRILSDIKTELVEAIQSREEIIDLYQGRRVNIGSGLNKLFSDSEHMISSAECFSMFQSHILRWDPINISTLEEIVTSGKIGIIQDALLRSSLVQFRNNSISNNYFLGQTIFEANVLVDDYPNLIIRNWNNEEQRSEFECQFHPMKANRFFLAQLQSNHGRMSAPIEIASNELEILMQIKKQIVAKESM